MTPTLHVIFKTHLDLGFTGLASDVRRQYHEHFIPMALDTGEHFLKEDAARPTFIWTTGSWLVWDHLNSQSPDRVARLERGIGAGIIRWHALPFTTHTELMSPALVREALSISADLDERFGVTTAAAKMTDVPGHTLGLVPLLSEHGVRFLHIGVNSASMPPEVPPVFRWRAPDGAEVLVMYQSEYGTTLVPDGMTDGIAFAHTMDNMGPQNVGHVVDSFHSLGEANPGFDIRASTLERFLEALWPQRETFPVVESEIGDTWIHGIGSAPRRVGGFLAARRAFDKFVDEGLTPARRAFGRKLLEVAEHTWGVDIKTYLRDEDSWDRPAFEQARRTNPRFSIVEASWAEQDGIVDAALSELDPADRNSVETPPCPGPLAANFAPVDATAPQTLGDYSLQFDQTTGSLAWLELGGVRLQPARAMPGLFAFTYESYDAGDFEAHKAAYLTARYRWGVQDHGKPGLERAATARSASFACVRPQISRLGADGLAVVATLEPIASNTFGAPVQVRTIYRLEGEALTIELALLGKPANRMPEAGFLWFAAKAQAEDWRMEKLGLAISPLEVVKGGNRQLHAVDAVSGGLADGTRFRLRSLDAPLFGPASQPFLAYTDSQPDMLRGGRFNLFNNKWGTNFSMWCEGDLAYRFTLVLKSSSVSEA